MCGNRYNCSLGVRSKTKNLNISQFELSCKFKTVEKSLRLCGTQNHIFLHFFFNFYNFEMFDNINYNASNVQLFHLSSLPLTNVQINKCSPCTIVLGVSTNLFKAVNAFNALYTHNRAYIIIIWEHIACRWLLRNIK